ncbi:hypothetical protein L1987_65027 [Smallanthus sonchifolius]|uniref:Uncharacterized protein n=1 Tax=Smallanthus sonchifolius TaxID=185202 RepID=A0ACB9BTA0_9ASTR|nr:hypothetical protein L1987_65027 [Smallanthus sonchifolius]
MSAPLGKRAGYSQVLPPPRLKYHDADRERDCLPQVGQWNLMNMKTINGGTVTSWICIKFSRDVQDKIARAFCSELAQMCNISGMEFNTDPVLPTLGGRPDQAERVLKGRFHDAMTKLQPRKKQLDLLIVILPDNNGSLYGDLKKICETDLGTVSHNAYGQDPYAKEFGIKISTELTSVEERGSVSTRITMVHLSVEIIVFEILTRVPAKVVGRFKSISKEWYALLSTQDFARVHCSHSLISSNQRMLLIGDLTCSVHPIDFQNGDYGPSTIVPFPFNDVSIRSHLDGLLCVPLNHKSELILWNPVTHAYKHLSTPECHCHGFFEHDAIGLYIDAYEDYKVLHIKCSCGVLGASIYFRRADSWGNIPFITRPEYVSHTFSWSTGTLCGVTLYFTICECWVGGKNVVICFDVNLEQIKEISFPSVPSKGIFLGDLVNVKNEHHMFVSTGTREMSIELWKLEGEQWIKVLSCLPIPPIPLSIWCDITHFMTNGNWFAMTNLGKLYEIEMNVKPFKCFYPVTSFRGSKGAMFVETLVSPSIYQFTMTIGQPKDRNDASTSRAAKRKACNARYYSLHKENGQPKDRNDASTSRAEKRKEYNVRYYAFCKENNKVSKDENIEDDPYHFVNDGIPRDHRVLDEVMPEISRVELDQRVYNRPTTSEVAGIWVEGNDNITSYKRSIVVYGRSEYSQTIQPYFGCYDPLSYPLFFPNGESGWHPNIPRQGVLINEAHNNHDNIDEEMEEANTRRGRTTVAMREYYCYKFQIRSTENVFLFAGRLLQQFAVDVYIKIETQRLQFCEQNQAKIRAYLYQGIVDCVNAGEVNPNRVGQRIVLHASFIGGPRDMRRRFLDAMTLVQDDGKPDLFLTMTCNPQWPEICDNLKAGQTAQDRPELVSRVFRAKS